MGQKQRSPESDLRSMKRSSLAAKRSFKKSNSPAFFFAIAIFLGFGLLLPTLRSNLSDQALGGIGLITFGLFPILIGVRCLQTGYAWQNLARGNRGVFKQENPKKFNQSILEHFVFGALLLVPGIIILILNSIK
ncbi:MAG: hypothetical protein AAGA58_04860 [Verrucomicrobiota bacterium]